MHTTNDALWQATIDIPLYKVQVRLTIDDNIMHYREGDDCLFGSCEGEFEALCSSDQKGTFGLYFRPFVTRGDIAHEIFHLTHRIMEHVDCKFVPQMHEIYAYLCGWLTSCITGHIEHARDKILQQHQELKDKPKSESTLR